MMKLDLMWNVLKWIVIPLNILVLIVYFTFIYLRIDIDIREISPIALAFGTFLMVIVTGLSYRRLLKLQEEHNEMQRAFQEPHLFIDFDIDVSKPIKTQKIIIRNDGHGIAKKVELWLNWASTKMPKKGVVYDMDWREEHLSDVMGIEIGSITSKGYTSVKFDELPTIIIKDEVIYGFILSVICEDMFGKSNSKYSDRKKYYISFDHDKELKGNTIHYA